MQSTAKHLQYASLCKNVNKHKPVIFQCLGKYIFKHTSKSTKDVFVYMLSNI